MSSTSQSQIESRKNHHIDICLTEAVEFYGPQSNGFHRFRFEHDALPELSLEEIDLSVTFLGKPLRAPLMIGAMTGGTERAGEINFRLARAAARCGVGFALGSQRPLLKSSSSEVLQSFQVRKVAKDLPLLVGNLGAVQLNYGVDDKDVQRLVDLAEVDALNLHLNPLQEAMQPEGDTNFSGLVEKIRHIAGSVSVPVFLKEVGSGFSRRTVAKIATLPISGIETAGSGGTSWARIEGFRHKDPLAQRSSELFATWGANTADSILHARELAPHFNVVASGGLRNGIEGAKALALGADIFAMALPFLRAAEVSEDEVVREIDGLIRDLRTVCFVTGSKNIAELRRPGLLRKVS